MHHPARTTEDPGRIYPLARQHAHALRRQAVQRFWQGLAQALRCRIQALAAGAPRHRRPTPTPTPTPSQGA